MYKSLLKMEAFYFYLSTNLSLLGFKHNYLIMVLCHPVSGCGGVIKSED